MAVAVGGWIGNVHEDVQREPYLGDEANVHQPVPALWVLSRSIAAGVQAVAGKANEALGRDEVGDAARGGWHLSPTVSTETQGGEQARMVQGMQGIICAPWDCFRQGYRDFGGNPEWEDHFVDDVLPCESRDHGWADTYELYVSRGQFHPDSWATAAAATLLSDPANPYHVGANVAAWSNLIESPGGSGGWAYCWW